MKVSVVRVLFFILVIMSGFFLPPLWAEIGSPRQQMEDGVAAEDVICKNNLQLMVRDNGKAICVKHSSTIRLVDSGLAVVVDTSNREPIIDESNIAVENQTENKVEVSIFNSTENIIIKSDKIFFKPGEKIVFSGIAMPNQELEVVLEGPKENVLFNDVFDIDSSGEIIFEILTDETFVEGTYFLISSQENDSEITPIRIGDESIDIASTVEKFNHDVGSEATFEIFGAESSEVELTILNSNNQNTFEDIIKLDKNGYSEYLLDLTGYRVGLFTAIFTQGTEEVTEQFTVGLNLGTIPIEASIPKETYNAGDIVQLYGKSSSSTLLLIEMTSPSGDVISKIEYFTDNNGKFTYPLKIPTAGEAGIWKIKSSNKSPQNSEVEFEVRGDTNEIVVKLDKNTAYNQGDTVKISGSGLGALSQITIQIKSSSVVDELTLYPKNDYTFSTIWQIPLELKEGAYTILVDDGTSQATAELLVE